MKRGLILMLMSCVGISGCVITEPQVQRLPSTQMDLRVDTSARRPQAMRPAANPAVPVDPKDDAPGRRFDMGPQSGLVPPRPTDLALFGRLPANAGAYVALDTNSQDAPTAAPDPENTYRLNFEDADVRDVLQAVLGKVLKLNYTVAPNATGRITIASTNPQDKSELLSTLETALATQGLSMIRSGSTYNITAAGVGGGAVDGEKPGHGYGISVVPLHYTSAATMSKLLGGLVTETDSVRVDTALNAMVVRGPAPRRADIVLAIKSFDIDWMHRQSTSVFELRRAKPEEVAAELAHIFDTENNGANTGLVDIKPVPRLRAVIVTSQNPALIRRAALWIRRLDSADEKVSHNVYVFRPKYRDARELVKLVKGLFGGGSDGDGTQDAAQDTLAQPGLSAAPQSGEMAASTVAGTSQTTNQPGAGTAAPSSFGSLTGGPARAATSAGGTTTEPIDAGQQPGAGGGNKLSLTADAANNSIVAYTDGTTYAKVLSVMRQLDVPPLQVAVNVVIAEVQLNDELKYGVQFFLTHNNKTAGLSGSPTSTADAPSYLSSALQGFNFLLGKRLAPDLVISALDSVSHVEILSSPSIVVMENKPATLQVGDQVPVTTRTAQSNLTADAPTVNSVDYKDTGIILKIQPRVGQDGSVAMEIDQEISSVSNGSSTLTPTISKRRIASDISVLSGQTVLLAGLISDRLQKQKGAVPFLSQTPLVGPLFDTKDDQAARTELVVFIRPVVIRNSSGAEAVAEDFKSHLKAVRVRPPPVYKP
ncbi:type II secretion system secretin GspD [Lichenifustis flavocetrariae]|uniref:Type II secretion system secretin GspD n=1 Tax=Lichenifustis flavocetrariae TaxID=2949735 RepID=A0AA41Z3Z6_9HYPH|nr:type II secretion system secretin GspD [Lichenifustis flavocetrariae]MCW6508832.1 type II secretion system secretin GspD [Lichenifustis flavocetrariae]